MKNFKLKLSNTDQKKVLRYCLIFILLFSFKALIKGQSFIYEKISTRNGLIENNIHSIDQNSLGNFAIGTQSGISTIKNDSIKSHHLEKVNSRNPVLSIIFDNDTIFYNTVTFSGYIINDQIDENDKYYVKLKNRSISIKRDHILGSKVYKHVIFDENVFFLTEKGVFKYDSFQESFENINSNGKVFYNIIKKNDLILLSDLRNNYKVDLKNNQIKILDTEIINSQIDKEFFHSQYKELENEIELFAGYYKGLFFKYKNDFFLLDDDKDFTSSKVNVIFEDDNKQLWIGTEGEGIYLVKNPNRFIYNSKTFQLSFSNVTDFIRSNSDYYIAYNPGGIDLISGDSIIHFGISNENLISDQFNKLIKIDDQVFGVSNSQLIGFENNEIKSIKSIDFGTEVVKYKDNIIGILNGQFELLWPKKIESERNEAILSEFSDFYRKMETEFDSINLDYLFKTPREQPIQFFEFGDDFEPNKVKITITKSGKSKKTIILSGFDVNPANISLDGDTLSIPTSEGLIRLNPKLEIQDKSAPRGSVKVKPNYSRLKYDDPNLNIEFSYNQKYSADQIKAYAILNEDTTIFKGKNQYLKLPYGESTIKLGLFDQNLNFNELYVKNHYVSLPPWNTIEFKIMLLIIVSLILIGSLYTIKFFTMKKRLKIEELVETEKKKLKENLIMDFHDELGNRLSSLSLTLDIIEHHAGGNKNIIKNISSAKNLKNDIFYWAKDFIWNMQQDSGSFNQLYKKIKPTFEKYIIPNKESELKFKNHIEEDFTLSGNKINDLKRIIKEAFTNILNHSKPKNISISFHSKQSLAYIEIINDGIKSGKMNDKGMGLKNIKKRAIRNNWKPIISYSNGIFIVKIILKDEN